MYIILKYNKPVCWEKFPDVYSAKVWCLHNGYARFKTINELGDKIIILNHDIVLEKIS